MINSFRKSERLCSKKALETLFEKGSSFYAFPFQVIWLLSPYDMPSPAQVAFSVSKKLFRRAVRRNLIKRRIREAYRNNKSSLYQHLESVNQRIIFIIIYKGDYVPDYQSVQQSVKQITEKLITDIKR